MDAREQLRREFNSRFTTWEIELPHRTRMEPDLVWFIVQGGWTIWTAL